MFNDVDQELTLPTILIGKLDTESGKRTSDHSMSTAYELTKFLNEQSIHL